MGVYRRDILPRLIDLAVRAPVEEQRQIIPQASERVLEVGFGSGLNRVGRSSRFPGLSSP